MQAKKAIEENWAHVKRTPFGNIYEATGCIGKFRLHVYIFLTMDDVLKKHSTSHLVVITDTAPIFCAKNKLTHKDALHILPRRKGNALSIGGLLPWVIPIRSNDMKKIPMDKIEPGMKLAKPIMSKSGMVLLSEGTELTEKWIERIQDMDVDGIFIDAPAEQTLSKEDALAQLDSRFKLLLNEPRMADIKSILRKHIEGLYG